LTVPDLGQAIEGTDKETGSLRMRVEVQARGLVFGMARFDLSSVAS
jgi:hypothetical protein